MLKRRRGSRNEEKYSSNIYTEGLGDKGIKNINWMYYKIAWDSLVQNVGSNGNPTSNARLNMNKRLYGQQYCT